MAIYIRGEIVILMLMFWEFAYSVSVIRIRIIIEIRRVWRGNKEVRMRG